MSQWTVPELIPHAGEMILLEQVVRFDDESLEARTTVRPNPLLSLPDGSLPAWIGLEIMAQTIAAYAGSHARRAGMPVELGFLLGTRNYQCNVDRFPAGTPLDIRVRQSLRDDNGMGVFECHIEGPGIYVEARLNVFRPPQVEQYLKESTP